MLLSFGVVSKDALEAAASPTASKHELIRTLHDFLLSLVPLHGSAVLIIDEAQHLSPDVLEEIRVLSNLETNDQKLLQIVIVGQLNLIDVLHKAELRQLDQRISIRCSLKALTREEVEAYVTHRLWVARGSTLGDVHAEGVRPGARALGRRAAHDQPDLRSVADGRLREADQPHHRRARRACGQATEHRRPKGKIKGERPEGGTGPPSRRMAGDRRGGCSWRSVAAAYR